MVIRTDSIFRIGSSHKVCQDYALHGKNFIVVSDGCSSSPDTDFGSRLLCLASRNFLEVEWFRKFSSYDDLGMHIIKEANNMATRLYVRPNCLDATLLCAYYIGNKVVIRAYGDGNIIIEYKDGKREIVTINFESGAPYYLSYRLDERRKNQYESAFPGALLVGDDKKIYHAVIEYSFDVTELKSVTLVSDGYQSFIKNKVESFELDLDHVIGFKNVNGEFLTRRIDRYLGDLKKHGVEHYDDFGCASMLFLED